MPIRPLNGTAAVARLSAIRFKTSVQAAAQALAVWESSRSGLLVPCSIELPKPTTLDDPATAGYYRDRARFVRQKIAAALRLDPKAANRLAFTMTYREAWYLGPRSNLTRDAMLNAVRASPGKYIELMLLKELIEAAAFDPKHILVTGGFGPSVYLGSLSQTSKRGLHLAEAVFSVNAKHGFLLCDVTAKVFALKPKTDPSSAPSVTLAADVGEGFMVGVARLSPQDFFELDARKHPMTGVSLDTVRIRQSRLYYLNVLTEFALALFNKAGVAGERETFIASHCVDEGYIPLEPLASLKRTLVVVNATSEPMHSRALKPLQDLSAYFPSGYHVAGNRKVHFEPLDVRPAEQVPCALDPDVNYLYLNGAGDDEEGSVRLAKASPEPEFRPARASIAYAALARGDSVADPYTTAKFEHLLERDTVTLATQGLNFGPTALASLAPGSPCVNIK